MVRGRTTMRRSKPTVCSAGLILHAIGTTFGPTRRGPPARGDRHVGTRGEEACRCASSWLWSLSQPDLRSRLALSRLPPGR